MTDTNLTSGGKGHILANVTNSEQLHMIFRAFLPGMQNTGKTQAEKHSTEGKPWTLLNKVFKEREIPRKCSKVEVIK